MKHVCYKTLIKIIFKIFIYYGIYCTADVTFINLQNDVKS